MFAQTRRPAARARLGFAAFLCAVLVLPLMAPPADAQYFGRNKVQYDIFNFRVLETEHFNIHYYPEAEDAARDVARMAERWYARLSNMLGHEFQERKPIILYADDTDFHQTNVLGGLIGEGLQGAVESFRLRLVMPITGSYASTDHVLGHEIVHQFQFDMSRRAGLFPQFVRLPLWIVEGMAEYFSVGRQDPNTAMRMRDAVIRDAFPTLEELSRDPRYSPYHYGQAFWAFVGGTFGDEAAVQLFRASMRMPIDSALVTVTGLRAEALETVWKEALTEAYLPPIRGMQAPPYTGPDAIDGPPEERLAELDLVPLPGRRVLARDIDGGNFNISPAVSPDGRFVAFLSERDLFGIDLFLADAQTGEIVQRLQSVATDPHLDAIRFIDSAGTWSPDGSQFAFVTFTRGRNEIAILDVASREIQYSINISGVGAIKDPAWSPDGRQLAFTGIRGGIANLYLVDVAGGRARQLTDDRHADLQPTWSPDGSLIAFITDRGPETTFELLAYSPLQLAVFDLAQNEVQIIDIFEGAKHINPQFSPDGESLYFVSNRGGISNVYRLERATGEVFQVTNVATGISGITDSSPTLSVSAQSGLLMYSVFEAQNHNVYSLQPEDALGVPVPVQVDTHTPPPAPGAELVLPRATDPLTADVREGEPPTDAPGIPEAQTPPVDPLAEPPAPPDDDEIDPDDIIEPIEDPAPPLVLAPDFEDPRLARLAILPPAEALEVSRVQQYLAAHQAGLPPTRDFPDRPYRARLSLDYITQPTAGVGFDPVMGFGFGGGIAARFSDMLGDNILGVVLQANGTFRDIGGQVIYMNIGRRLNWGATAAHIPFLQVFFTPPTPTEHGTLLRILQRTFLTQVGGLAAYPFSQTLRVEGHIGARRIGQGFEFDEIVGNRLVRRTPDAEELERLFGIQIETLWLGDAGAAVVGDYSVFGLTSPVRGARYRFGADATAGSLTYGTATADYRHYLFIRPFFTLAARGMHYGRYGPDADSERLFPLYIGHGTLVRGYSFGSFDFVSVAQVEEALDRLYGTAVGVANLEFRMPLLGPRDFGLIEFPWVPTEFTLFADAGMAWGEVGAGADQQTQFGLPFSEQRPIFSSGAAVRVNVLGAIILEGYLAHAFNRPDDRNWIFGINLAPGW